MPRALFQRSPNEVAAALIRSRRPVSARVFFNLLPELQARAFTVSGIEGANALQRLRDALAAVAEGEAWSSQKRAVIDELEPYLGEEGAAARSELILRVNGFQAFSSSLYQDSMADGDTTHLQYIHGDIAKVPTPSHLALDGIILPKTDPFWLTHTGPWGHIGCVCYVRPMNPDLVEEERVRDRDKNPEDRNVLEGPALDQLRHGTIIRGIQRYDISPPAGPGAFRWHPADLRLSVSQIMARYDPDVRDAFELWARRTMLDDGRTVWAWLNGA